MRHGQEDDPLASLVYPVDYSVVAHSKAVASLEFAPQPLPSVRLRFEHLNMLVNAEFEVLSQSSKILLEPPGRLEPIAHGSYGAL